MKEAKEILLKAGALLLYMTCSGSMLLCIVSPFTENVWLIIGSVILAAISIAFMNKYSVRLLWFMHRD